MYGRRAAYITTRLSLDAKCDRSLEREPVRVYTRAMFKRLVTEDTSARVTRVHGNTKADARAWMLQVGFGAGRS